MEHHTCHNAKIHKRVVVNGPQSVSEHKATKVLCRSQPRPIARFLSDKAQSLPFIRLTKISL